MRTRTPLPSFDIYRDHELDDICESCDEEEEKLVDPIKSLAIDGLYLPAVTNLLSFLDPIDLARASCVSKAWNDVIVSDPKARSRKESYVRDMRELRGSVGQENWPLKEPESSKPVTRGPFRDLKCHQPPVRQHCHTPHVADADDDVFCKSSSKSVTKPSVHHPPLSHQSIGRLNACVSRTGNRTTSSDFYKTPQFKSMHRLMSSCNSGGDSGSLIKQPLAPLSHLKNRSVSCNKSISRRLLDDEGLDVVGHRRLSLAGSRSSKKNLRRL